MTEWTTNYFGRFRIDLPNDSEVLTDYKIYNEKVELLSKNGKTDIGLYIEKRHNRTKSEFSPRKIRYI